MKRPFDTRYRTLLWTCSLAVALQLGACDTFDGLIGDNDASSETELYPVLLDGRWGYINAAGRMVIEPQFQDAGYFTEGLARVRHQWRYGYIDAAGNFVIEPRFEEARSFTEGRAAVRIDGRWGYVDRAGAVIINPQFTAAHSFAEGRAFIRTANWDWEYIDATGQVVRTSNTPDLGEIEESEGSEFSNGLALFRTHGDMYGYLGRNGEPVIPAQYTAALPFSGDRAAIKISDRWGYIDAEQNTVISPQFISAESFAEDLAPVRRDGNTWGYADRSGNMAIQAQYEEARPFVEGRAAVMIGGKWGFIDHAGNAVVPPQFDEVLDYRNGLARVQINIGEEIQRYGYLDKSGAYVWYPTD